MSKYIKIIASVTFVSFVCAFILAWAYNDTKNAIEDAYRLDFLSSLSAVLPEYDNFPDEDVVNIDGKTVYIAKKHGTIVGYSVVFSSNKGYSGTVEVIVGMDTYGRVSGAFVLQHKETPGLGDKISHSDFLSSFVGLSEPETIAVKKDGGVIEQFSGATMSPRAVAEAVSGALSFLRENFITKRENEAE